MYKGKSEEIEVDEILIASGRKPNVEEYCTSSVNMHEVLYGIEKYSKDSHLVLQIKNEIPSLSRALISSLPTSPSTPLAMVSCFFIILTFETIVRKNFKVFI